MRGPPRGLCRAGCRSAGPEPHGGGYLPDLPGSAVHAGGEEFARTKHGDHNTYRGPLELNRLDWTRAAQLEELVQYYHGLLEIRKAYPELSGMAGMQNPAFCPCRGG